MITPLELFQESEQRFRHIAWGCILFYAVVALALNLIRVEKPAREDFTQMSPRIASLLVRPPPPPVEVVKPAEEVPPPESAEGAKKEEKPADEKKPAAKVEPTPEQIAKRNRQVAMRSGLLKLLAKKPASSIASSEKLLQSGGALKSSTSANYASGLLGGGSDTAGSGGIDQLIGDLGGKVEGIRLAERQTTAVENPLQLKDTEGKAVGRAYESIASVVDGLKGWIRFIYNKALRDDPSLKGVVTLEFTITPQGDVTNCRVASTTLNYPEIEDALVKRFKLIKFAAAPKSGPVTVIYPVTFSPLG
jgi:TonB family protein